MQIGDKVIVKEGASAWMKDRNFWLDDMPESIDGEVGIIIEDYTSLSGDDSHYGIDFDNIWITIGVNPKWLTLAGEDDAKTR